MIYSTPTALTLLVNNPSMVFKYLCDDAHTVGYITTYTTGEGDNIRRWVRYLLFNLETWVFEGFGDSIPCDHLSEWVATDEIDWYFSTNQDGA